MKARVSSLQIAMAVRDTFAARPPGDSFQIDGVRLVDNLARVLDLDATELAKLVTPRRDSDRA